MCCGLCFIDLLNFKAMCQQLLCTAVMSCVQPAKALISCSAFPAALTGTLLKERMAGWRMHGPPQDPHLVAMSGTKETGEMPMIGMRVAVVERRTEACGVVAM